MTKFGLAQPVRRVEDPRLLLGQGRYTDDVALPGAAHAILLRSPHANARIVSIDTAAAKALPGVLAVYTGRDLEADGIGGIPCVIPLKNRDGTGRADVPNPALALDAVHHVGNAVALVVAETAQAGKDAAEAILVEYDILDSVTDLATATDDGQPLVWPEVRNNVAFDWETGDKARTDALFAQAAHTVAIEVVNNRIVVNSMEARAAAAEYDAAAAKWTLTTNTQGGWSLKDMLAKQVPYLLKT